MAADAGFTLTEIVVAAGIGSLIVAATLAAFISVLTAAAVCQARLATQAQAVISSQKLLGLVRNSMGVHAMDNAGNWVELQMPPTGGVCRLSYTNPSQQYGQGQIVFTAHARDPACPAETLASGLTKVPTLPVRNIFELAQPHALRLTYRVMKTGRQETAFTDVVIGARFRNQ